MKFASAKSPTDLQIQTLIKYVTDQVKYIKKPWISIHYNPFTGYLHVEISTKFYLQLHTNLVDVISSRPDYFSSRHIDVNEIITKFIVKSKPRRIADADDLRAQIIAHVDEISFGFENVSFYKYMDKLTNILSIESYLYKKTKNTPKIDLNGNYLNKLVDKHRHHICELTTSMSKPSVTRIIKHEFENILSYIPVRHT